MYVTIHSALHYLSFPIIYKLKKNTIVIARGGCNINIDYVKVPIVPQFLSHIPRFYVNTSEITTFTWSVSALESEVYWDILYIMIQRKIALD